jgi:hypothetical protein
MAIPALNFGGYFLPVLYILFTVGSKVSIHITPPAKAMTKTPILRLVEILQKYLPNNIT